jgi:hypothetical protein
MADTGKPEWIPKSTKCFITCNTLGTMRVVHVAAAQLRPIPKADSHEAVVKRMIATEMWLSPQARAASTIDAWRGWTATWLASYVYLSCDPDFQLPDSIMLVARFVRHKIFLLNIRPEFLVPIRLVSEGEAARALHAMEVGAEHHADPPRSPNDQAMHRGLSCSLRSRLLADKSLRRSVYRTYDNKCRATIRR